ncbi:MAG TPA: hypothetical protein VJ824_08340 [Bacillota bacterium]|nr:hypothetical protein [Bacillota bacterium]
MPSNVISLRKVKRRKKIEAIKEIFFSPVTIFIAGVSIVGGIGIYGSYHIMNQNEMLLNMMLASY